MRKLKLQMFITVDGFVAGPNGEEDWFLPADEKLWDLINELPDTSDTLLIGRKMATAFLSHFEGTEPGNPRYHFAQKMVNIPKIIFSKTLQNPIGKNTSLATGNLADEIARLKAQPGKDILVYGGAGLVSSLIAGGHIDEFYLLVMPILLHEGMRIFDHLTKRQKLILLEVATYDNGIMLLHYKLNNH